jgi:cell division protein FtsW
MRYPSLKASRRRRPTLTEKTADIRRHKPDYLILVLMSFLLVCGAVVVYAIGPGLTIGTDFGENYFSSKQLTAIGLGIMGFAVAAFIPLEKWKQYQVYVIVAAILSAVLVRFVGEEINGAHRWITIGGFSFQTAELVKLALVLWLASFLSDRRLKGLIEDNETLKHLGALVIAVIVVVVGLQSDLGSAAVMVAIIGLSAYVSGVSMKKLWVVGIIMALLTVVAIGASEYRRERVTTFLNPTADCQAEGYQACQALITIGSGGLFGKGLGKSVQAYGYLPEPANDSIFAIVAEKFGFVGSMAVLGVFWALFRRISKIAKSAPTDYARLLVNGVLVWLSVQMVINIGAMVGILPLKGITLPFVSYGGTSIIFVMIAMGIVFQVSRYTELVSTATRAESSSSSAKPQRYRRRL